MKPEHRKAITEVEQFMNKAADPEKFASHQCTCPGTNPEDPWAHRSAGMKCRTCCWFVLKKPKTEGSGIYINNNRIGRCRRHAPTMSGYPVVFEQDWCGDHKLDENKV